VLPGLGDLALSPGSSSSSSKGRFPSPRSQARPPFCSISLFDNRNLYFDASVSLVESGYVRCSRLPHWRGICDAPWTRNSSLAHHPATAKPPKPTGVCGPLAFRSECSPRPGNRRASATPSPWGWKAAERGGAPARPCEEGDPRPSREGPSGRPTLTPAICTDSSRVSPTCIGTRPSFRAGTPSRGVPLGTLLTSKKPAL